MRRQLARSSFVLVAMLLHGLVPVAAQAATEPLETDPGRLGPVLAEQVSEGTAHERVDVLLRATAGPSAAERARGIVGDIDVTSEWSLINGFSATMTIGQVRALSNQPWVERIEAPQVYEAMNGGATAGFGVDDAAGEYGVDGSGVTVCVLDTGIRADHEQFNGPGGSRIVGWMDFIGGQPDPYDDHSHGTHVAGTLAGDGDGPSANAALHGGVAPGAALVIGKVLAGSGSSQGTSVEDGIDWCAANPSVDIISMSLGTTSASSGNDTLSQMVNAAVANGIVVVVAAGNTGDAPETVGSPGAARDALTVGAAADSEDENGVYLAPFSSRGPTLAPNGFTKPDIVAPGVRLTSASTGSSTAYSIKSGTSMATPFVAGAVALGLEAAPGASPATLKAALESTAHDWGIAGKDNDWGSGLIDVHGFVAALNNEVRANELPAHVHLDDQEAIDGATWSYEIEVDAADVGEPLAATVLIDGELVCVLWFFGCAAWEWGPDLEMRLLRPDQSEAARSECPLSGDCPQYGVGRQETVHVTADQAGTWTIEVWPWDADPNDGVPAAGGTFDIDLSLPTAPGTPPPPPPPPDPPAAPTLDSVTAVAFDQVDLSWSSVPDADTYTVEHSSDGGSSWSELASGLAGTNTSHTGLDAGSTNHYRVLAVNAGGSSPPSNVGSDTTPPETPMNLVATAAGTDTVNVQWDAAAGATSYTLEHSLDGSTWAFEAALAGTSFADTGLDPDTTHHYRVRATNTGPHPSDWSNVDSATTDPDTPPPPPGDVDDTATSESTGAGTVVGSHLDTLASDDDREVLTEEVSGRNAKNQRSQLQHDWSIEVTGGNSVSLHVEAHRADTGEGDAFAFSYSTDGGASFVDTGLVVTKTVDDDVAQVVPLPADTTGTVIVRVEDVDRTRGNGAADSLHVDHLFIRSSPDEPPPPPPSSIDLEVTGHKVKGVQHADLSWSGATSAQVDIVRDGMLIATVDNTGTWTDNIGNKGAGSYTYRVCEAGTSSCSDPVTVTF
ncbi:MAG: S8 family serine peptidase [Nitriliruptorales bacterium]|nr:S8 family serine peptidase [Nitriliruptorales bacterium]